MDEFSFIESIQQRTYTHSSLIKGIGDDAAVIRNVSQDLVTSVDTVTEGVHFLRETMRPYDIGYKALASNISDLAAMGAKPAFYLVSIMIPEQWSLQEVQTIFTGMRELAASYQMDLIGGDTVSGATLTLSITVLGYVEKGKARYRSAAEMGDVIFVSGTLGDAQAGLHILLDDLPLDADNKYFVKRHQQPSPRVALSEALEPLSRLALNDISDGLASEANEIATASQVDLYIDANALPVHHGFQKFTPAQQENWLLYGGEDYELLGTVNQSDWAFVQQAALETGIPITQIGEVKSASGQQGRVYLKQAGAYQILEKKGYHHFK